MDTELPQTTILNTNNDFYLKKLTKNFDLNANDPTETETLNNLDLKVGKNLTFNAYNDETNSIIEDQNTTASNDLIVNNNNNNVLIADMITTILSTPRIGNKTVKPITQASFKKVKEAGNSINKKWNKEEEALFYKLLGTCGLDFEWMAAEFANAKFNKNRKQILLKFKKEDKINSDKITEAMRVNQIY